MQISDALVKMISFSEGNIHDISHFQKVWCFAKMIAEQEGIDPETQQTLELAAVVHDIACPLCRKKYGNTEGKYQEMEGPALAREFYEEFDLPEEQLDRICYLVGHHHSPDQVDGIDYQILLEADFLVNADESQASKEEIINYCDRVFHTKTGIELLNEMYTIC